MKSLMKIGFYSKQLQRSSKRTEKFSKMPLFGAFYKYFCLLSITIKDITKINFMGFTDFSEDCKIFHKKDSNPCP